MTGPRQAGKTTLFRNTFAQHDFGRFILHEILVKLLALLKIECYTYSMRFKSFEQFADRLKPGYVYRRNSLLPYSKALDRDLAHLVRLGLLEKIASGLYYVPEKSRFGVVPPKDKEVVRAFLRDDEFLMFSWNEYNNLNLGLTQLYNHTIVYNYKRHGIFKFGNRLFDFRRLSHGFPKQLTQAFLIVDLLNNLNELSEDSGKIKANIEHQLSRTNFLKEVYQYAIKYGKVATRKFLDGLR